MSTVRRYVLTGTADERARLVEELKRWCTDVLGYPTRQANIARWMQMPMSELRHVHECWRKLIAQREATTAAQEQLFSVGERQVFDDKQANFGRVECRRGTRKHDSGRMEAVRG